MNPIAPPRAPALACAPGTIVARADRAVSAAPSAVPRAVRRTSEPAKRGAARGGRGRSPTPRSLSRPCRSQRSGPRRQPPAFSQIVHFAPLPDTRSWGSRSGPQEQGSARSRFPRPRAKSYSCFMNASVPTPVPHKPEGPPRIPGQRAVRPKNAATVMIIRRDAAKPRVLMGKRHGGHSFMPDRWVFPGGRIRPLGLPGRPTPPTCVPTSAACSTSICPRSWPRPGARRGPRDLGRDRPAAGQARGESWHWGPGRISPPRAWWPTSRRSTSSPARSPRLRWESGSTPGS